MASFSVSSFHHTKNLSFYLFTNPDSSRFLLLMSLVCNTFLSSRLSRMTQQSIFTNISTSLCMAVLRWVALPLFNAWAVRSSSSSCVFINTFLAKQVVLFFFIARIGVPVRLESGIRGRQEVRLCPHPLRPFTDVTG